jgi:hypothetical protein
MKICLNLEITSRVHTNVVLEAIRVELRRRALGFVFDAIDTAKFGIGDGPVDHKNFHVTGEITLED